MLSHTYTHNTLREKKLQHTHSHIYTHPCLQLHMHDTQLIKYSYIYMCSEDIKKKKKTEIHNIHIHDTQYIYMTQTTHSFTYPSHTCDRDL